MIGIFVPEITNDLSDKAKAFVGKEIEYDLDQFRIDFGVYAGEMACWSNQLGGWVPRCDIKELNK